MSCFAEKRFLLVFLFFCLFLLLSVEAICVDAFLKRTNWGRQLLKRAGTSGTWGFFVTTALTYCISCCWKSFSRAGIWLADIVSSLGKVNICPSILRLLSKVRGWCCLLHSALDHRYRASRTVTSLETPRVSLLSTEDNRGVDSSSRASDASASSALASSNLRHSSTKW